MSADAAKFLNAFAQSLATMALYTDKHPARERAVDHSFEQLRRLQETNPSPQFSFLGLDVIYGQAALRVKAGGSSCCGPDETCRREAGGREAGRGQAFGSQARACRCCEAG